MCQQITKQFWNLVFEKAVSIGEFLDDILVFTAYGPIQAQGPQRHLIIAECNICALDDNKVGTL